jgi:hypothetical protein
MNKVMSILLSLTVAVVIASPSYSADPTPPPLPPDYVAPLPQQFNKDGALAFRPDGTPLAGFNADGSVNTNLPKPIDPRGLDGATQLPAGTQPYELPNTSCLDLGVAFKGTPYEVNFGSACGGDEIIKMWRVISDYSAYVATQSDKQPAPKPSLPPQPTPSPSAGALPPTGNCIDLGTVYKNTQYEVKFGDACGQAEKEKMWKIIADYSAWVSTQPPVVITDPKDNQPAEVKSVSQTAITQVSGKQINIKTGFNLPSVITDTTLKAEIDKQITESTIKAVKTSGGYLLDASKDISAIDTTLKFVATKGRAKPINLVLTADKQGEMMIKTSQNLKGYTIQIKRGSTVLKSVAITK